MTLQSAAEELYRRAGEPSDLNPYSSSSGLFTPTSPGAEALFTYINNSLKMVATWKFPDGRRIRFRECDGVKIVSGLASAKSGIVGSADTTFSVLTGALASSVTGYYAGWSIEVAGESRLIVDSDNTDVTLLSGFSSNPGGLEFFANKRSFLMDGSSTDDWNLPGFIEVEKIVDLGAATTLAKATTLNAFAATEGSLGTPSLWRKQGRGIEFDVAPSSAAWYKVFYFRYPEEAVLPDQDLALPEAFHEAVLLGALWSVYRRYEENTSMMTTWKGLTELMSVLRSSYDYASETSSSRLYIEEP